MCVCVALLHISGSVLGIDKLSTSHCNLETLPQRAGLSYNISLHPALLSLCSFLFPSPIFHPLHLSFPHCGFVYSSSYNSVKDHLRFLQLGSIIGIAIILTSHSSASLINLLKESNGVKAGVHLHVMHEPAVTFYSTLTYCADLSC